MIKVLFLGQKPLGEACFYKLLEASNRKNILLSGVVTNFGTDNWWASNSIFRRCKDLGVPVIDNKEKGENFIKDLIKESGANLLLSVQHSWILSQDLLNAVEYGGYNLHNAKLPDYKGYNSFSHAILNQEKEYFSTIHRLDAKVDSGDIVLERSVRIEDRDTARSLYAKALAQAIDLFSELLTLLEVSPKINGKKIERRGRFYTRNSLDQFRCVPADCPDDVKNRICRALFFPPYEPAFQWVEGAKKYLVPEK